jgi:hypothetical protein
MLVALKVATRHRGAAAHRVCWVAQKCFRSPGRVSGTDSGPVLAGNLARTDHNPGPNCPGLRSGQFGTGIWSVRIRFAAKSGSKPAPETRPGTGNTIEQHKIFDVRQRFGDGKHHHGARVEFLSFCRSRALSCRGREVLRWGFRLLSCRVRSFSCPWLDLWPDFRL